MKGIVYVKFPKAGLGNLLLVWSRARVFAHINHLPMVTSPWWGFRWGAWLRGEKMKRLYWRYFRESSLIDRVGIWLKKWTSIKVIEPSVEIIQNDSKPRIYYFSQIVTNNDLFGDIRKHRDFIKKEIYELLSDSLKSKIHDYTVPVISVHIRRGDFKFGNPITPLSFFIDAIKSVRSIHNSQMPVTVFTDADMSEIEDLMILPDVYLSEKKADILDILLMSMSKVIILSQSSTFSYWGAFLSDAVILKPHTDWQQYIRSSEIYSNYPEINWKEGDEECVENLRKHYLNIQNI